MGEENGMWLCSEGKKGVCNKSISYPSCKKWIYKWCCGLKGSLLKASQLVVHLQELYGLNTDLHLDIGNGVSLEKVVKFCYLGEALDADGGWNSAITARVRSAWKKFCKYLPILTRKGFSLKLKGKVYATCVSHLMHGSETWPMKVQHNVKLNHTEMSMIRWKCGFKLDARKKSEEVRQL